MNYVIKIKFEDTLRRLTFPGKRPHGDHVGEGLTFEKLEGKIRELFKIPADRPIRVTYIDRDDDVITMGDDQDLEDACVLQGLNPLRLNVVLVEGKRVGTTEGQHEYLASGPSSHKETVSDLKETLKALPADVMKPVVDHVQQLLKGTAASPRQLTDLVDKVVYTVTSHIDSAVKKGQVATHRVTGEVSPSICEAKVPATISVCSPVARAFNQNAPVATGVSLGIPVQVPVSPLRSLSGGVPTQKNAIDNEASQLGNACRVFHSGVQCDGCGMNPIVGPRFKSNKKDDYDLCVSCYKDFGSDGDYQRIDRPLFRPRHLRCPALNPNFHAARGVHVPVRGKPEHMRQAFNQVGYSGKLDARFVQDVTIFDGTELAPMASFTKIWRLRNSGTLPWPLDTKLVHVGGDELGNVIQVPLELPEKGLAPGDEVDVSVDLVAPEKPGRYVSHWRLASPAGPKFGHRVWVLIQVVAKETAEDSLISEMSSASTVDTVKEEEDVVSAGGAESTDGGDKAENGTQGVLTGHNLFLAEDYPRGLMSSSADNTSASPVKEGQSESPSEPTSRTAVDEGTHVQVHNVVLKDMEVSKENDVISKDSEHLEYIKAEFSTAEEDVNQTVMGIVASSEKTEAISTQSVSVEDASAFVNSELGMFSIVDLPPLVSSTSSVATVSTASTEAEPATRNSSSLLTAADSRPRGEEMDVSGEEGGLAKEFTSLSLCEKLEGMGFSDRKLNLELLKKNNMDLRRTLDEYLYAAAEWDPILEELEEMGFYDVEMNRRLMFKNNGSVKRVVKELVQMYKEPVTAAKDKGKGKEVA